MKRWHEPMVVGRPVALPKQPQPRVFAGMVRHEAAPAGRQPVTADGVTWNRRNR